MKTIAVTTNQVSQPEYVAAGSRVTLSGSGYVEWTPAQTLQDAKQSGATWQTWPGGTSEGSQDVVRGMAIRVVGTGDCTVTVEAGRRDDVPNGQYWDAETVTAQVDPLTGGIGNLTVAGELLRIPPGATLYNANGLRRWRLALADALNTPATIMCIGDSVTVGIGSDGANNASQADSTTDLYGWPAQLRRLFAKAFSGNEMGSIRAMDPRVTKGGTVNPSLSTGWMGNPDGTTGGCASVANAGTLTFALPACTEVDIWYLELKSATAPNWTYAIDGGGAQAVTGTNPGSSDTYKKISVSGLSNAAHSLVITSGGNNVLIVGVLYKSSVTGGVCVVRSAAGGFTTSDFLGIGTGRNYSGNSDAQRRIKLANFSMLAAPLTVIALGHNDCSNQLAAGQLTTVAKYKQNLQAMIDDAVAAGGCVLLVSQPDPPNAEVGPDLFRDYWTAAREICDANSAYVSHIRIIDEFGAFANANAAGLHTTPGSPTVHLSRAGYGDVGRMLFRVLTGGQERY